MKLETNDSDSFLYDSTRKRLNIHNVQFERNCA